MRDWHPNRFFGSMIRRELRGGFHVWFVYIPPPLDRVRTMGSSVRTGVLSYYLTKKASTR